MKKNQFECEQVVNKRKKNILHRRMLDMVVASWIYFFFFALVLGIYTKFMFPFGLLLLLCSRYFVEKRIHCEQKHEWDANNKKNEKTNCDKIAKCKQNWS